MDFCRQAINAAFKHLGVRLCELGDAYTNVGPRKENRPAPLLACVLRGLPPLQLQHLCLVDQSQGYVTQGGCGAIPPGGRYAGPGGVRIPKCAQRVQGRVERHGQGTIGKAVGAHNPNQQARGHQAPVARGCQAQNLWEKPQQVQQPEETQGNSCTQKGALCATAEAHCTAQPKTARLGTEPEDLPRPTALVTHVTLCGRGERR